MGGSGGRTGSGAGKSGSAGSAGSTDKSTGGQSAGGKKQNIEEDAEDVSGESDIERA